MLGPLRGGGDPGGATLDQQLAKVLYTPTGSGLPAKLEQVELALKLDAKYSKAQILEMYLNAVYFGHGYYGLPAASRGYFGRSPAALNWPQASLLAGLVQAPSAYDPLRHLDLARARQAHVLDRLTHTNVLTPTQAASAERAPLDLRQD
jgi:membrane peptidoglycan carboxypeptidase